MEECLFCKIVKGEIPSEKIFENKKVLVIKDIHPKAEVHLLILPKKHISSIKDLTEKDKGLVGEMIFVAKGIAKEKNLKGYKLIFNVGREGGQLIDHLHLHLLSGKKIELP
jgi:histidine triad (HIT) family protein